MNKILLIIISISISFADIYISGDARVRPRYDVRENYAGNKKVSDLYYLYRARLNIKSEIGEGYFFSSKLGTNEIAAISKMASDGEHTSLTGGTSGNLNSSRPQVDFLQLYFGFKKEKSGFWAGAFPLKSNPALDIHFYPSKMVDIPFALLNNGSITGFAGYQQLTSYKLNWFVSIDTQVKDLIIDPDDNEVESNELYTLGFDTKMKLGPLVVAPQLLATFGGDTTNNTPSTIGANLDLMDVVGFKPSLSYFMSNNNQNDKYDASHIRLSAVKKMKVGDFKFFYDMAKYKKEDSDEMDLSYMWLSYAYKLFDGDLGSVKLMPTIRIQNGSISDPDYSRSKFELTTEIKFK